MYAKNPRKHPFEGWYREQSELKWAKKARAGIAVERTKQPHPLHPPPPLPHLHFTLIHIQKRGKRASWSGSHWIQTTFEKKKKQEKTDNFELRAKSIKIELFKASYIHNVYYTIHIIHKSMVLEFSTSCAHIRTKLPFVSNIIRAVSFHNQFLLFRLKKNKEIKKTQQICCFFLCAQLVFTCERIPLKRNETELGTTFAASS